MPGPGDGTTASNGNAMSTPEDETSSGGTRQPPARQGVAALALLLAAVAAGCGGGPVRELGELVPTGQSVVGAPGTVSTATTSAEDAPLVTPGARGGPVSTLAGDPVTTTTAVTPEAPTTVAGEPVATTAPTTTVAQLRASLTAISAESASLFKPDTTNLDADGLELVDRVAAELRTHPGVRVEVAGHTDTNGTPDSNLRISQQRADVVRDRLVAQGIDPALVVATGYGQTKPRATNDTVEGRALNRRIEFNVLG